MRVLHAGAGVALLLLQPFGVVNGAGRGGRATSEMQITQIYESTKQVQRVVMSRALLK